MIEVTSTMIGESSTLQSALQEADLFAHAMMPILITGENGTGKELLAQRIHLRSERKGKMVAVNCGAVPATLAESLFFGYAKGAFTGATQPAVGFFKEADGGTLFLDEIGELSLEMQVKLLRVLETSEFRALGSTRLEHVDVRIIAATNRDLWEMVQQGRFREDVYWRIHGAEVHLPPLRERGVVDIRLLAEHYVGLAARKNNLTAPVLSAPAMAALVVHRWTGNVRELRQAMERATILAQGKVIQLMHLPRNVQAHAKAGVMEVSEVVSEVVTETTQEDFILPETTTVTESAIPGECETSETFETPDTVEDPEVISVVSIAPDEAVEDVGPTQYFDAPIRASGNGAGYVRAWRGMYVMHRTLRIHAELVDVAGDMIDVVPLHAGGVSDTWRVVDVEYRQSMKLPEVVIMRLSDVERWRSAVSPELGDAKNALSA